MSIAETVPEILASCADGFVPVNVDVGMAIEAHQRQPSRNTLYVVIMAREPTVADTQRQLDYLVGLPDKAWQEEPNWEQHREQTLAHLRRSIAWRSICG